MTPVLKRGAVPCDVLVDPISNDGSELTALTLLGDTRTFAVPLKRIEGVLSGAGIPETPEWDWL